MMMNIPRGRPVLAPLGTFLCALLLLAGCASDTALKEGQRLIAEGKTREGLTQLEQAMRAHPGDLEYRTAYLRQRDSFLAGRLASADAALRAGQFDQAQALYQEVLALHPENNRAVTGLAGVETARRNLVLLGEAQAALQKEDLEAARSKLRGILAQELPQTPVYLQAQTLLAKAEEKAGRPRGLELPQLSPNYRRPVTLEFRDAPLKTVFDALSRQSGLNIVFDKDVRVDQKTTVFARGTAIVDALDMLLTTNQLARKVLNGNTLLIYPNLPAKQRDYQDMVVRAFFLTNADPKQTLVMIKTMARIKDVHVDEKLNMVIVRDTPEAVRIAEKLVRLADRPEPEVMLEVEILEVKRSKLQELGVQWPTSLSVLTPESTTSSSTTGGVLVTTTTPAGRLTVDQLRKLRWGDLGVTPNPSINLNKTDGDVNILANPRIRVKNKEKAKVHVGDKVPVITSNVTSTGVTSESVSYLDVGLKLDVEPQVYLENEVGIKVGLEVSNIVQQVKTSTGTLTYQLGSRNATTTLRLKDGETQVLAGLISDEERASANKVPGLGDIPLLGRLFSNNRDENSKSEIVLLITPRILRNIERPELADAEFFAGTEAVVSGQQIRVRPALEIPRRPEQAETAQEAEPSVQMDVAMPPEAAPAAKP
jgi:general secretion pathway protein D